MLLASTIGPRQWDIGNRSKTVDRAMRRLGVRQHQRMFAALVLEEVVDAVLFHQPAHEIHVSLAVLNAIFELRTGPLFGQFGFIIGEAAFVEDLLDDVGRFLVLKDPTIGGPRQQPKPRPQHDPVAEIVVVYPEPLGLRQNATELALLFMQLYGQRTLLTNGSVEVEVGILTETLDAILEQFTETFRAFESGKNQNVFAKRRLEFAEAGILSKLAHVGLNSLLRSNDPLQRADQTLCKNRGNPACHWQCRQVRPGAGPPDVSRQPSKEPPWPSSSRLQELAGSRENGIFGNEPRSAGI
ncbi:hypothetical protein ACVWWR_006337 [Bradyrhizobium sp. LM3.2]